MGGKLKYITGSYLGIETPSSKCPAGGPNATHSVLREVAAVGLCGQLWVDTHLTPSVAGNLDMLEFSSTLQNMAAAVGCHGLEVRHPIPLSKPCCVCGGGTKGAEEELRGGNGGLAMHGCRGEAALNVWAAAFDHCWWGSGAWQLVVLEENLCHNHFDRALHNGGAASGLQTVRGLAGAATSQCKCATFTAFWSNAARVGQFPSLWQSVSQRFSQRCRLVRGSPRGWLWRGPHHHDAEQPIMGRPAILRSEDISSAVTALMRNRFAACPSLPAPRS